MKTISSALFALAIFASGSLHGQDYPNSIVSTDFDIITEEDPSCFTKLDYQGFKSAEMPDKRQENAELFHDAHVFVGSYSDNSRIEFAIDKSFDSEEKAKQEALLYATRLGKLPTALRSGVKRVVVHKGDTTAFSDVGLIICYSENAQKRIKTKDLEETLFHESVHAAWDKKHAKSAEWKKAQKSDGTFVTAYAKKLPELEDLAETSLFAYAVIHHFDRLPAEDAKRIQEQVPARIAFVEKLIPRDKPLIFEIPKGEYEDDENKEDGEENKNSEDKDSKKKK